jgi:Protein-arginine deiminase (PAD)
MPDFELRADFDHDGTRSGSQSEYEARNTAPGALLPANADADKRRLPNAVTAGTPVTLDFERYTPSAADDEVLSFSVEVNNAAAATGRSFAVRVPGIHAVRVRIYDETGKILPTSGSSSPGEHPIAILAPRVPLQIETRSYPGSPFGHATTMATTFNPASEVQDEIEFTLELISRTESGSGEVVHDTGKFSVAPVLFLDNGAHAFRMYISEKPANAASVADIREALRAVGGVELLTVDPSVSEDSWLQDQFQPGMVLGADGWRQAIVHLPRLRSDFIGLQSQGNLAAFVTSHFPSHNVGLMNDFWTRSISFSDASGATQSVSFVEGSKLVITMLRVFQVIEYLDEISAEADHASKPHSGMSWSQSREQLEAIVVEVKGKVSTNAATLTGTALTTMQARMRDAAARAAAVVQSLPFNAETLRFTLKTEQTSFETEAPVVDELYFRIEQMQRSANYGGNIESSPPSASAPLGKIVIGNATINESIDHMDPDVRRFLYEQRQPVVEFDTTWLDVGHIDELLTFVPSSGGGSSSFAALRASPGLGMKIIEEAIVEYRSGLPENHPQLQDMPPSGVLTRLTYAGSAPVTRLMRGKVWSQIHPPPASAGVTPDILEPPRMYQDLARAMNNGAVNVNDVHYQPGQGPARAYPADISVLELKYTDEDGAGESVNEFIESEFLAPLIGVLESEFEDVPTYPLPVIFDRVANTEAWSKNEWAYSTSAYTPDLVNMQVLNGHLLIPRPYGPRMRPANATAVLTRVLKGYDWGSALASQLNPAFYRHAGLDTTTCWIVKQDTVYTYSPSGIVSTLYDGIKNLDDVVKAFKDGFPGVPDATIGQRIQQANRANFEGTGTLREGPRKFTIPEGTVDLFEAYTQLVLASLGLTVHWIDSWFYHVIFGGIHCGTNVLREPPRELPQWWTAAAPTPGGGSGASSGGP